MLGGRSDQFDSLVEAAGLSPACLTEPDSYIGAQPFGATLQLVSSRMNKPSVGLDWAAWSKPYFPQLGPLMLASAHARTLRDFIELAGRYLPGHTNAYRPRLIYQSVRTELAYRFEINSRTLDRRQVIEHLLAVTSLIFEVLTGVTENKHVLVRFRHARPSDITPHQAIFRSPVEFNADHNEIIFASKQLELPILCSQRNIKNCALHLINDRMADLPDVDGSVSSRVAIAIRAMLGVGVISLDTLADVLMSGRRRCKGGWRRRETPMASFWTGSAKPKRSASWPRHICRSILSAPSSIIRPLPPSTLPSSAGPERRLAPTDRRSAPRLVPRRVRMCCPPSEAVSTRTYPASPRREAASRIMKYRVPQEYLCVPAELNWPILLYLFFDIIQIRIVWDNY